jgi:transposase
MASSVPTSVPATTAGDSGGEKRRRRSVAERRRIVEQTLTPGTSVARVARAHGVNANQVFYWRSLYRRGRLGAEPARTELLPVTVIASDSSPEGAAAVRREGALSKSDGTASPGAIHIDLPRAHLRIEGRADADALRVALETLRG